MGAENCCTVPEAEKHGFDVESSNQPQNANIQPLGRASVVKKDASNLLSRNSSKQSFVEERHSHRAKSI